jgi:hypothetical protein
MGESEAQAEIGSKDAVHGLDELAGEIDSSVEAAGKRQGGGIVQGLAEDESGERAACDHGAKLEVTGGNVATGTIQVTSEVVGHGPDARAV